MAENLAAALAALQASLPHVGKQAQAQYGRYADLADITKTLLPRLAALDLIFTSCPTLIMLGSDPKFVLEYRLEHAPTGEHRGGMYPLGTGTPQQLGSAITYARRYCLCAVTGVAPDEDDDDAQAAEQEARALSRRPPETDEDGAATFAEQERMLHDQAGWEHVTPESSVPPRSDWDSTEQAKPDPMRAAMGAMFAIYKELGVTEKDPMLFDISEILDKPVTSRSDLSLEEVAAVNGVLRKRRDAARKAGSVTHA